MGILDNESPEMMGLLQAGLGILANSRGKSLGEALGAGGMQGLAGMQQARDFKRKAQNDDIQRNLMSFQLEAAKTTDERRKAVERMLPTMSDDVQQAYLLGGPDKAFETMQANKFADTFRTLSGQGQPQAAVPVPLPALGEQQGTGAYRLNVETDAQRANLSKQMGYLQQNDPETFKHVYSALVKQGALEQPMTQPQQQPMDAGRLAAASAEAQIRGIKGASGYMELAKLMKPEMTAVDSGGQIQFVNKNGGPLPTIQKSLSPGEKASNELGWANHGVAQFNAQKPTYHDGAMVNLDGTIVKTPMYVPPKGSPEALAQSSARIIPLLDQADSLLNTATGSYAGIARDTALGSVGISTEGAKSAAQLKALEGAIMMNQPRMEGPQSDKDVDLYRQMAAQVGDSTVPVETRRAALQGLRNMQAKYTGNTGQQPPQSTMSGGGWSATVIK